MAKKAFVYDGTNWIDIAQSTTDLSVYSTTAQTFVRQTSSTSSGEASTVNINTKPWNMPWGTIGHVIASGSNTTYAANTFFDVVNATLTRTFIAGRKYKIEGSVSSYSPAGAPNFTFFIDIGGSTVRNYEMGTTVDMGRMANISYIYTPGTTASTTVKLRGRFTTATGILLQDGGRESILNIEDIGPA